jgi:gliding-associated putative ABC transporter substrate-binding component GldG
MAEKNRKTSRTDAAVMTVAVLGCLVVLNILGLGVFGRLDLTRDKQYTLNKATLDTLAALKEPVTVRAYFTKDLPPPYATQTRYVQDLLEEYHTHGKGQFRYEFIDPASEETNEDKEKKKETKQDIFGRAIREATSVERELSSYGIPPVQVRVNEDDKIEVKRAYMGIVVMFNDKKEVIPVVQQTEGLEYDLTSLLRKITRERAPKVAVVTRQGEPSPQETLGKLWGLLGQLYDVTQWDVSTTPSVEEDVDALIVLGSSTPYTETEQKAIDAFVMTGKSAAFLLDAVKPELQTLEAREANHGLTKMLAAYGVKIDPGLVLDAECATISVTQQRGFMRIAQPVQYPFMVLPKQLDPEQPLTRGLTQVVFPFMSPLALDTASKEGVKSEVLVKSSANSWIQKPPFNLDPMQEWGEEGIGKDPSKPLVVSVSGALTSAFNSTQKATQARVLVAGGSSFLADQFLSRGTEALALNLVDWLVLDEGLLAMRARGLSAAPLADVSDSTRNALKYSNIMGVPLTFIAGGLVRWRRREARRAKVVL